MSTSKPAGKATGPKSAAGKARSALNALKHGRYSKHPSILAIEDADAFRDLFRTYLAHFNPASLLETRLVQELTHIDWSLTRFRTLETGFLNQTLDLQNSPLAGLPAPADPLQRLCSGLHRSVQESSFAQYLSVRTSRLLIDRDRTLRALTRARQARPNEENLSASAPSSPLDSSHPSENKQPPTPPKPKTRSKRTPNEPQTN
ncbi:MAG: hypothetical protein KJZ84_15645 [Bryobacteraceae bacterium]|nr:hypothetical protein [Bryobacteraceae bacterium]